MADTTVNGLASAPKAAPSQASPDVTVMDLWLVVRAYRRFASTVIVAITAIGAAVAFYLTPGS